MTEENIEENIEEDIVESDDTIINNASRPIKEASSSFGLAYFLGEKSVPAEVDDLMASLTEYADGLLESCRKNPQGRADNDLSNIKEENPDNSGHEPSKQKLSHPISSSNLNPLSKPMKSPNLGASFDSGKINSAMSLLDLKSVCKSFAYAVRQHIIFARGKNTFAELKKDGNPRFSYRFGKVLKIELNEQRPIDVTKAKDIFSESLAAMTGAKIKPEMIESCHSIKRNTNG